MSKSNAPSQKTIRFILFAGFIAAFIFLTEIREEWFTWLKNPYIKYPFFIFGLIAATSLRNFFVSASTLALEIPAYAILATTGTMEANPILSYFLLLALIIPGAMLGLFLFEKYSALKKSVPKTTEPDIASKPEQELTPTPKM